MNDRRLTLTLVDGVRVVVPDTLDLITPYVLQEQHDWFEDEIRFMRVLLEPGDQAIDIGANYGVYTLSMARAVGPGGRVFAYEPASHPASFLELSLVENAYSNVTLDRCALSHEAGSAKLAINQSCELNELVRDTLSTGEFESVQLTTLDAAMAACGWDRIDFVKIDAEGEEANIVAGGMRFFSTLSPLVQYEVKAGDDLHLELIETFAAVGYASYRLVPSLDLLVPFAAEKADSHILNLFACKPDRAASLAARGLLVTHYGSAAQRQACLDLLRERAASNQGGAIAALLSCVSRTARDSRTLTRALALHALSHDRAIAAPLRATALSLALEAFVALCERHESALRHANVARAALDSGLKSVALDHLSALAERLTQIEQIGDGEPFVAPSARFDAVERHGSLRDWLLAATVDAIETRCSFSSFFERKAAAARLALMERLGYADEALERRVALIRRQSASADGGAVR